jgi:hypothetical protein
MQIQFQTKEQSNQQQLIEFIKLPKYLRFFVFVELSKKINNFPSKNKVKNNTNFVIDLSNKNGKLG